nr:MAG TPA: hypothetical protein [Caudoviricetes sp.]
MKKLLTLGTNNNIIILVRKITYKLPRQDGERRKHGTNGNDG